MNIRAKSITEAWKKSLKQIIDQGIDFTDHDNRVCRELNNLLITIDEPVDFDAPLEFMKSIDLIYPSKEELSDIILNKEQFISYQYSYGPRIFNYENKVDQINDFLIPLLKKDPTSRRAVINIFNPAEDSNNKSKNIPSLMFVFFKIQNQKLNLTLTIRSNDIFIGWPGNIYQICALQDFVAKKLGLKCGSITTFSCSAHIFLEHVDMIKNLLKQEL